MQPRSDAKRDLSATFDCQSAAFAEVVLHVDDDEGLAHDDSSCGTDACFTLAVECALAVGGW